MRATDAIGRSGRELLAGSAVTGRSLSDYQRASVLYGAIRVVPASVWSHRTELADWLALNTPMAPASLTPGLIWRRRFGTSSSAASARNGCSIHRRGCALLRLTEKSASRWALPGNI